MTIRAGTDLTATVRQAVLYHHGARIAAEQADVDDLVQDVLLRLLESQRLPRSRWERQRGLSASSYVYRLAHTAGANSLRRRARWNREVLADDDETLDATDPTTLTHGTDGTALARAMALMDLDDERAMLVHLAAGRSMAEAGRCMGLAEYAALELGSRVKCLLMAMRED